MPGSVFLLSLKPRINCCRPEQCTQHLFNRSIFLGLTIRSEGDVERILADMAADWPEDDYDELEKNCVDFSVALGRRCFACVCGIERKPQGFRDLFSVQVSE